MPKVGAQELGVRVRLDAHAAGDTRVVASAAGDVMELAKVLDLILCCCC